MKNFEEWSKVKKEVDDFKNRNIPIFHESEIWWSSIGLNIGDEQDGKNESFERPVLILKKFSKSLFMGIPLSTKIKEGKLYVNFKAENLDYSVLLSQTRVMSVKRLSRFISKLSRGRMSIVKNAYKNLLEL